MSVTRAEASARSNSTPPWVGSMASTMFSATVMTGMSMKCWWTIPIPSAIASLGDGDLDAPAPHADLALVRAGEPVEHVHQG